MAFFGPQEVPLAEDNGFFGIQKGALRIKPAGVFVMSRVDGFYAAARKNIFFGEKSCQVIYYLFFNNEGCE